MQIPLDRSTMVLHIAADLPGQSAFPSLAYRTLFPYAQLIGSTIANRQ
jgi:hypothetical protein